MRPLSGKSIIAAACVVQLLTWATLCAAQQDCTATQNVPTMTIKIFNNTNTSANPITIFPVLTGGAEAAVDEWMQGCFAVTVAQATAKPPLNNYPRASPYRFYINPNGGILPGNSVTVTLPLFSQLVASPSAAIAGQYIDWWQGGRIEIFTGQDAVNAIYTSRVTQQDITSAVTTNNSSASTPQCVTTGTDAGVGTCLIPKFFSDTVQFLPDQPSQLTEYTLAARNPSRCATMIPIPADCPAWVLDTNDVDIDISYVDSTFLPAAMEPFNNPGNQTGWIGMITDTETFGNGVTNWLNDVLKAYGPSTRDPSVPTSWPLFVNPSDSSMPIDKIPSAQNVLLSGNNATTPYPTYPSILFPPQNAPTGKTGLTQNDPPPWPPIQKLIANWVACTNNMRPEAHCEALRAVHKLFAANYQHYQDNWANAVADGKCTGSTPLLTFDEATYPYPMIAKVYGWVAFNNGCASDYNPLYFTPGYSLADYQAIKAQFDDLQYDGIKPPLGPLPLTGLRQFNPYVLLIHGAKYLNAENVYAYSVDDAVGNLQVYGDGFIITVGGPENLPNPDPATKPVHVNFGAPYVAGNGKTMSFDQYGVCTTNVSGQWVYDVNPNFFSFVIGSGDPIKCPVSLKDNLDRIYTAKLDKPPPYPQRTELCPPPNPTKAVCPGPANYEAVNCSDNIGGVAQGWCRTGAYVYTDPDPRSGVIDKSSESYLVLPAPAQPPQPPPFRRFRR